MEKEIASDIFELTEDGIYTMIDNLSNNHCIDQSLVYCFIKALYLHTMKLYLLNRKSKFDFDLIYEQYKEKLKKYYKTNNPTIDSILLDQILDFFDNSFALIDSLEFSDIEDSYEYRHHVIKVFEILRIILENKSKSIVRENIFENYTRIVTEDSEKICKYFEK